MAKYDSGAVDEAYAALRARFADAGDTDAPRLALPETASASLTEAALRAAAAAFPQTPIALTGSDDALALADALGLLRA